MTPKIMIILGSGSDIAIAEKSMDILEKLDRKILKDLYNDFLWEVYVRAYTTVENEKEINKNKDKNFNSRNNCRL